MKRKKQTSSKKCIFCGVIILAVLVVGVMVFVNRKNTSIMASFSRPKLCYGQSCIYVQITSTEYEREQGLMYHTSLDENKGMLLEYAQPGIYGASMRNVAMPLDMIRLDKNYTILFTKDMAPSCTTDPCPTFASPMPATYILEINSGTAEKIGLKVGKTFTFQK